MDWSGRRLRGIPAGEAVNLRILVTGASGFLGRHLVAALGRQRHEVLRLTRGALDPGDPRLMRWDPRARQHRRTRRAGPDAVIHLAGEGIADARWTEAQKQKIRDSRILGTRLLVDALGAQAIKPKVFFGGFCRGLLRRPRLGGPVRKQRTRRRVSWPRFARTGRPRPAGRRIWAAPGADAAGHGPGPGRRGPAKDLATLSSWAWEAGWGAAASG